jgi:hypothetical protein
LAQETDRLFWQRTNYKVGKQLGDSPQDQEQAKLWMAIRDEVLANHDKFHALPKEIKSVMGGDRGVAPRDYEKALRIAKKLQQLDPKDRAMRQLDGFSKDLDALDAALDQKVQTPGEAGESPEELQRLFQVLKDRIKDPQFGDAKGMSWVKFAKFLDTHKDKIEGVLRGSPPGRMTQEKMDQIITEYGNFIAAEPAGNEEPDKLETQEEFDKKFPAHWRRLPKRYLPSPPFDASAPRATPRESSQAASSAGCIDAFAKRSASSPVLRRPISGLISSRSLRNQTATRRLPSSRHPPAPPRCI